MFPLFHVIDPSNAFKHIALIFKRSFLTKTNVTINCRLGVMDVSIMNIRIRLNIFKASSQPTFEDESEYFFVDVTDKMIEKTLPAILSSDSLGTCFSHGD